MIGTEEIGKSMKLREITEDDAGTLSSDGLDRCPHCGCEMHLDRDEREYRLIGDHKEWCPYDGLMNSMPVTNDVMADISELTEMWNKRTKTRAVNGAKGCPHCGCQCTCVKIKKDLWRMDGDHELDCALFMVFDEYHTYETKAECEKTWNKRA